MNKQVYDVLVVGAGPVGLSFALEALRRGLTIKIIDKKAESLQTSNAVRVNIRTLELLEKSGASKLLIEKGNKLNRQVTIGENERIITQMSYNQLPHRFNFSLAIKQFDTESILARLVESKGVKIERSTEIINFDQQQVSGDDQQQKGDVTGSQQEAGVRSVIQRQEGTKEEVYSRYLVGADGVHSFVRTHLNIEYKGSKIQLQQQLLEGRAKVPEKLQEFFTQISPAFVIGVNLGNGNYRFASTAPDVLKALPKSIEIESVDWQTKFYNHVRQVDQYQKGRVFIAGDAAHCHTPAGGRGMNLGIEDACILAALISKNKTDIYTELRYIAGLRVIRQSTWLHNITRGVSTFYKILGSIFFLGLNWIPSLKIWLLMLEQGLAGPQHNDILQ